VQEEMDFLQSGIWGRQAGCPKSRFLKGKYRFDIYRMYIFVPIQSNNLCRVLFSQPQVMIIVSLAIQSQMFYFVSSF